MLMTFAADKELRLLRTGQDRGLTAIQNQSLLIDLMNVALIVAPETLFGNKYLVNVVTAAVECLIDIRAGFDRYFVLGGFSAEHKQNICLHSSLVFSL